MKSVSNSLPSIFIEKFTGIFVPVIFLVLGVFLRFWNLDLQSLWGDELFSVLNSSLGSVRDTLVSFESETNPPLHGVLLHFWIQCFSNSPFSVRAFSAVVATITLIFVLFRYIKTKETTDLYVFIFFSVSYGAVYFAQEARSYSLLILFSTLLVWLFLELIHNITEDKFSLKIFALFILFGTFASYTHYFGILFLAHLYLLLIVLGSIVKRWKFTLLLLFTGVLQLLLYAPEIYKLLVLLPKTDRIGWIPPTGIFVYFEIFNYTFFSLSYKKIPIYAIITILFFLGIFKNKGSLNRYFSNPNSNVSKLQFQYLGFLILIFLISTALISIIKPILTGRNLLVLLYPSILFVSLIINSFEKPKEKTKIIIVSLFALLFVLSFSKDYYKPHKEHYKQTVEYLISTEKGTELFSYGKDTYFNYYFEQNRKITNQTVLEFPKLPSGELDLEKLKKMKPGSHILLVETSMQSVYPEAEKERMKKLVSDFQTIPIWGIKLYKLTK
ncbi:MAG: hypothetical protein MUF77_11890 [Leptospira sp.]|nr:hypothetical protein [Leptospira sp.]